MRLEKVFRFLVLANITVVGSHAFAQGFPAAAPSAAPQPAAPASPVHVTPVIVDAGSGRLIQLPGPAATILAADPRIARVQPASPTSIFVMGVAPGRTTVIAAADNGTPIAEYDVMIRPGSGPTAVDPNAARAAPSPSAVEGAIRRSLPGMGAVHVTASGRNSFLMSGTVANASESQRAEAIARATAGENREIINNLELLSSTQVNVRVRVAEISRQITHDLGFNWQALGRAGSFALGLRTGSSATTVANAITGGAISSGYGAGVTTGKLDINSVIDALAADQLITILAEPNLTAQSGETASFLAGGEFPVPTGTSGSSNSITVDFKQFGVSLSIVPTVLGPDRLNLRVRPEVSELTTTGSVSLPLATGSVTIPALQVRRAETTVELGTGQSFAIAGLLQRNTTQADTSILGLGDLPVVGPLFRTDSFLRTETELVIIVTPYLVQPVSDPNRLVSPTDGFQPALDLDRIIYRRQLARGLPMPQLRSRPDAGFIVE